jgi:hypothetical protein
VPGHPARGDDTGPLLTCVEGRPRPLRHAARQLDDARSSGCTRVVAVMPVSAVSGVIQSCMISRFTYFSQFLGQVQTLKKSKHKKNGPPRGPCLTS